MLFSLIQTAHSSGGIDKEGEDELDGNGEKISQNSTSRHFDVKLMIIQKIETKNKKWGLTRSRKGLTRSRKKKKKKKRRDNRKSSGRIAPAT
jgi:hypothetical protein